MVAPNRNKERGLNMKIVRNLTVMAAVAASLAIAAQARADTINFLLSTAETGPNPTKSCRGSRLNLDVQRLYNPRNWRERFRNGRIRSAKLIFPRPLGSTLTGAG